MIRTSPLLTPAIMPKTIEQQNSDFTASGSPPTDIAETSPGLKATPGGKSVVAGRSTRSRTRSPKLTKPSVPILPHERDETVDTVGTMPSEPMKQASRDIKRGLTDTDRGAEAGRTYQKLKR